MNIPNEIAQIIAGYSIPTLWKLTFGFEEQKEFLFYANNENDIIEYMAKSEEIINRLHTIMYSLYRIRRYYQLDKKEIINLHDIENENILQLNEMKNYIINNTSEIVIALSDCSKIFINFQKINPINLY